MDYTFTLKYQIAEDTDVDALVEALGEGGCDDALVGIGQPGRLALAFTREAGNAKRAFRSALADVKAILPEARLSEAGPDFVGLSDVADIVGVSRQNMRKLMLGYPGSFPPPVHDGSTAIWHLADILAWLDTKGGYNVDRHILDTARAALSVNLAKAALRSPKGARDFVALVG